MNKWREGVFELAWPSDQDDEETRHRKKIVMNGSITCIMQHPDPMKFVRRLHEAGLLLDYSIFAQNALTFFSLAKRDLATVKELVNEMGVIPTADKLRSLIEQAPEEGDEMRAVREFLFTHPKVDVNAGIQDPLGVGSNGPMPIWYFALKYCVKQSLVAKKKVGVEFRLTRKTIRSLIKRAGNLHWHTTFTAPIYYEFNYFAVREWADRETAEEMWWLSSELFKRRGDEIKVDWCVRQPRTMLGECMQALSRRTITPDNAEIVCKQAELLLDYGASTNPAECKPSCNRPANIAKRIKSKHPAVQKVCRRVLSE